MWMKCNFLDFFLQNLLFSYSYKLIWNTRIKELVENPSVRQIIQQDMDLDPSEGRYRNLLFKLFNRITFEEPLLTAQGVLDVFSWKDDFVMILSRLSALEVALVISNL